MDCEAFREFMNRRGITLFAAIPFSSCRVTLGRLLERETDFVPASVLVYLVPYYAGETENLSVYAAAEDYHLFFSDFSRELIAYLSAEAPAARFLSFGDRSPIDERDAAVRAGLGVIGRNGLLLTERYSSCVFIGDLISDLPPEELPGFRAPVPPRYCDSCGACLAACPTGALSGKGDCLSAVTQRKGQLTPGEEALILRCGTVWGCDACQNACPYTKRAKEAKTIETPIPFFRNNRTPRLTLREIEEMPDELFARRAYAWRGRETLLRNLRLFEGKTYYKK